MRSHLALVALLVVGCGRAEAEELLEQLRDDDYQNTYARAPGWEEPLLPSTGGPHGDFVDIYINDVLVDVLAAGEEISSWPSGSLIVKDAFRDEAGESLKQIALMEKQGGDWFWAEYVDGDPKYSGKNISICTKCHSSGDDLVLAFGFP